MSDQNGTENTQMGDATTASSETTQMDRGKGKAVDTPQREVTMEDDDDEEEESGVDDHGDEEHEDEDNMEEIDMDNIVESRTRGKTIDYAKAAQEQQGDEEEDEDDDEDYEEPDVEMEED